MSCPFHETPFGGVMVLVPEPQPNKYFYFNLPKVCQYLVPVLYDARDNSAS
jgi:hypothetical protein